MTSTKRNLSTPDATDGLSADELRAEQAGELPDREAMSILDVGSVGVGLPLPGNLDGNLDGLMGSGTPPDTTALPPSTGTIGPSDHLGPISGGSVPPVSGEGPPIEPPSIMVDDGLIGIPEVLPSPDDSTIA